MRRTPKGPTLFDGDKGPTLFDVGFRDREGHVHDSAAGLYRRSDPVQSREAAESIVPVLEGLRRETLEAVRAHPGLTAQELAVACDVRDPRRFNRRLTELKRLGSIRVREVRPCRVTGRRAATWEVVS